MLHTVFSTPAGKIFIFKSGPPPGKSAAEEKAGWAEAAIFKHMHHNMFCQFGLETLHFKLQRWWPKRRGACAALIRRKTFTFMTVGVQNHITSKEGAQILFCRRYYIFHYGERLWALFVQNLLFSFVVGNNANAKLGRTPPCCNHFLLRAWRQEVMRKEEEAKTGGGLTTFSLDLKKSETLNRHPKQHPKVSNTSSMAPWTTTTMERYGVGESICGHPVIPMSVCLQIWLFL